jgi:hypothetical protein
MRPTADPLKDSVHNPLDATASFLRRAIDASGGHEHVSPALSRHDEIEDWNLCADEHGPYLAHRMLEIQITIDGTAVARDQTLDIGIGDIDEASTAPAFALDAVLKVSERGRPQKRFERRAPACIELPRIQAEPLQRVLHCVVNPLWWQTTEAAADRPLQERLDRLPEPIDRLLVPGDRIRT